MSRGLGAVERLVLVELAEYDEASVRYLTRCHMYERWGQWREGIDIHMLDSVRRAAKSLERKGLVTLKGYELDEDGEEGRISRIVAITAQGRKLATDLGNSPSERK